MSSLHYPKRHVDNYSDWLNRGGDGQLHVKVVDYTCAHPQDARKARAAREARYRELQRIAEKNLQERAAAERRRKYGS